MTLFPETQAFAERNTEARAALSVRNLTKSFGAERVLEDAQRRIVTAALAELPVEQREALELGYYSGLSQSEIAERTGQPLGTVKTRMRLAMQKLRSQLQILRSEGGP